jgi:allose kinase
MTHRPSADAITIAVAEIGGTSVKIGFADKGCPAPFAKTFPTLRLRKGAPICELASILREASTEAGLTSQMVIATVPGFVDRDFDTVLHAANIPELNGHRLASELADELALPVRLERDVVLQLLGESTAGAVAGQREILAVYFGTGIGAAYLGEHGIFRGGGWALEIGHMPVYSTEDGQRPRRIENYASGTKLVELAKDHKIAVSDLFATPDRSPRLAKALDDVIWQQAVAVATATVMYSPRTVLLGGGVVEIVGYPRRLLENRIGVCLPLSATVQPFDIRWASLGWQAAIHGAVSIYFQPGPVVRTNEAVELRNR